MDQKTFVEGLVWGAGALLTFLSILAYVNTPFRKWFREKFKKHDIEQNSRIEALEVKLDSLEILLNKLLKSDLANLRSNVYDKCVKYISDEYICKEDLSNLTDMYEAYSSLGGNGTCKTLYLRVLELPIGNSPDCAVDRLR